jgi:hypothetical protein
MIDVRRPVAFGLFPQVAGRRNLHRRRSDGNTPPEAIDRIVSRIARQLPFPALAGMHPSSRVMKNSSLSAFGDLPAPAEWPECGAKQTSNAAR